jgi:ATP-dependent Clp protease ATP-binding subunit ClpA
MYERYTEKARHAIFFAREEAAGVGSSYIEPEHLLLAVMRFCEADLDEALKLKALEDSVRTELARTAHRNITSKNWGFPLSNQSTRILRL